MIEVLITHGIATGFILICILFLSQIVDTLINRIDKLEAQIRKDRSDIADYLNEQLKNKQK